MTHIRFPSPFDMSKDISRFYVGFDDQFNRLAKMHDDLTKNIHNYPPYNIKKIDNTHYVIELAVAGFDQNEIDIAIENGKLIVKGNISSTEPEDNFLFKGIANRAFTRDFVLNDQIEVKDAELYNGMLKITLEKIVPEEKTAKKIPVNIRSQKQFLAE